MSTLDRVDSSERVSAANFQEVKTSETEAKIDALFRSIAEKRELLKDQKDDLVDVIHFYSGQNASNIYTQISNIKKICNMANDVLEKKREVSSTRLRELEQMDAEVKAAIGKNNAFLGSLPSIGKDECVEIVEMLIDPASTAAVKKEMREKIASNPGLYEPQFLLMAALEFFKAKEFEKAACLYAGSVFRSAIDIRLSGDPSLESNLFVARVVWEANTKSEYHSEEEQKSWQTAWDKAVKNFEVWDKATPREYKAHWLSWKALGVTEEEKAKIIETFYRELKVKTAK